MRKSAILAALTATLALGSASAQTTLLNVSYDLARSAASRRVGFDPAME